MKHLEQWGILEENVSLENLNTYKIKTKARYLLHPRTVKELQEFVSVAKKENWPFWVLGNGSNVILADTMYNGVIIKLDQFKKIEYNDNQVVVGAGVMINYLSKDIINHGLSGLEWASGIPGTVGGSIYGNAEAYNVSTFHYLKDVTFLNKNNEIVVLNKEDISHAYRTSYFKEKPGSIILEATFVFPDGDKEKSLWLMQDRLQRRLATQPLDYPSAGSVFRNPSKDLPSGKLIDDLGLKGFRIGDAMVSVKHANFIVNLGNATGKDIRNLIKLIHAKVEESYHIDLTLEQEFKDW